MSWIKRKVRDFKLGREAEKVYGRERNLAKGQIEREEEWQSVISGKRTKEARKENVKRVLNTIGSWARNVQDGIVEEEKPRRRRKRKR